MDEAEKFLRFIVKYLEAEEQKITANQTMNYGYWLVKFVPTAEGRLDVWEYDPSLTNFLHGGSLTLKYCRDQQEVCKNCHAVYTPPNPGELTAISFGVMEGRPVQAVRYNIGEPMSGWIIVTDQYDGNI
ncbi:hypothetical protein WDZ92_29420, partial [Nostoc sp. NIES-2111]